jgi:hypothetical protein
MAAGIPSDGLLERPGAPQRRGVDNGDLEMSAVGYFAQSEPERVATSFS